jgi:osmoprotectant transport system permease protein
VRWDWIGSHGPLIWTLSVQHVILAVVPVLAGLVIAVPLGVVCSRYPRIYGPILLTTSVAYAIPSLALFVFLIQFTGFTYI